MVSPQQTRIRRLFLLMGIAAVVALSGCELLGLGEPSCSNIEDETLEPGRFVMTAHRLDGSCIVSSRGRAIYNPSGYEPRGDTTLFFFELNGTGGESAPTVSIARYGGGVPAPGTHRVHNHYRTFKERGRYDAWSMYPPDDSSFAIIVHKLRRWGDVRFHSESGTLTFSSVGAAPDSVLTANLSSTLQPEPGMGGDESPIQIEVRIKATYTDYISSPL